MPLPLLVAPVLLPVLHQLARRCGLPVEAYVARLVEQAVKRTSEARLLQGLKRAAGIDRMIKGLAKGDVWDELLQLGLRFAAPRRMDAAITR